MAGPVGYTLYSNGTEYVCNGIPGAPCTPLSAYPLDTDADTRTTTVSFPAPAQAPQGLDHASVAILCGALVLQSLLSLAMAKRLVGHKEK